MSDQKSELIETPHCFIDLNCDVGEGVGAKIVGNDDALIPLVSSVNIACGAHGGDHQHTANAVRVAMENGVKIGAHPSYPDRQNFGRLAMSISADALRATMASQLNYLGEIVSSANGSIGYVKPHGALYHACAFEIETAEIFLEAVISFDDRLAILGQPGSAIESLCNRKQVRFVREAFADRQYLASGRLKSRDEPDAVFRTDDQIVAQAISIATGRGVTTESNHNLPIRADSICVHGDSSGALSSLKQICSAFSSIRVVVRSF